MTALPGVDARYRPLFDRAVAVLGADPRVVDVRLAGSVAAGTADEWSDLDIVVTAQSPVEYAVHEQLRGLAGPLPKLLMRGQHVEHFMAVGHTFGLLATVAAVEHDLPVPSRGVVPALPHDVVAAIPPVAPTFDALLAYELAVARQVVGRARPLFERFALVWPETLESIAARRLQEVFGVDTSAWLRVDAA